MALVRDFVVLRNGAFLENGGLVNHLTLNCAHLTLHGVCWMSRDNGGRSSSQESIRGFQRFDEPQRNLFHPFPD